MICIHNKVCKHITNGLCRKHCQHFLSKQLVEEKFTLTNNINKQLCKCGDIATINKCENCDLEDFNSHL